METPESIERLLERRLVPGGFSADGAAKLESLIDELTGAESSMPAEPRWWSGVHWGRCLGGAAAVVALMLGLMALTYPDTEVSPVVAVEELLAPPQRVVLLEDREGVVAAEQDQELFVDTDGSLHRAWHVQIVSEEHFHDEQSGEQVRVVHPRDELVLMPVTTF